MADSRHVMPNGIAPEFRERDPSQTDRKTLAHLSSQSGNQYARIDSVSSSSSSTLAGRHPSVSQSLIHLENHQADEPSTMPTHAPDRPDRTNHTLCSIFVFCIIVVSVYLATIVWFISCMEIRPSSSSSSSSSLSSLPERENCVTKEEMRAFTRLWDPEDGDLLEVLVQSGDFTSTQGKLCFHSLQWVPLIMGKISASVEESVKYIERQQEKLNETVSVFTSLNATQRHCKQDPVSPTQDSTYSSQSVYAHFFLNTQSCSQTGLTALQWQREGRSQSSRRGIDVNVLTGQFTVRHSGFYFLYSHVTFRSRDQRTVEHQVVTSRSGENTTLLKTDASPSSVLQGVFMLRQGDRLFVRATTDTLYCGDARSTYFGTYLIRT